MADNKYPLLRIFVLTVLYSGYTTPPKHTLRETTMTDNAKHLLATIRLDEALQRVRPRPRPSFIEQHGRFLFWFACAALGWWFTVWFLGEVLANAAFDAVNGFVIQ